METDFKSEDRLVSCCFTGHRPIKLKAPEEEVRKWLEEKIDEAIADGYRIFITGCAMGVDIWAGQIVLKKREKNPALRLIAASPFPDVAAKWEATWKEQYEDLLRKADHAVQVSDHFFKSVYMIRNTWMVDHSHRLIACYNGAPGGTKKTILYAEKCGLEVIKY